MKKRFRTWYFLFTLMPFFIIFLTGCEKDEPEPLNIINASTSPLAIYPNPSNGIFYLDSIVGLKQSALFNAMGQTIKGEILHNSIDLTGYPAGIYFLKATDENGNTSVSRLIRIR